MISDAANLVDVESHVLRYWEDELELKIPRNEMGHRYYTKENIEEFQKIKELKEQGYQLKAIRLIVHNGTLDPKAAESVASVIAPQQPQPANSMPQTEESQSMHFMSQSEKKNSTDTPIPFIRQVTLQRPFTRQTTAEFATTQGIEQVPLPQSDDSRMVEEYKSLQQLQTSQLQQQSYQQQLTLQQQGQVTSNPEKMAQFRDLMSEIVSQAIAENNKELSRDIGEEVSEQVLKEINYLAREQEEAEEERFRKLDAAIREKLRKKEHTLLKWNRNKTKKKPSPV